MKTITVDLGERSYPILIGENLLADPNVIAAHVPGRQVLIVTNETIAPLYLDVVTKSLGDRDVIVHSVTDGEGHKTLDTASGIFDTLLGVPCDRGVTIVALGGGVVGDMAGFAAACYQRGVNYVQMPTTLLSQVDSSVGGKTAVNHPAGKNMIGAFHQPVSVITDVSTLSTLPEREFAAGMAEVIKYGAINDPEFFTWLEDNADAIDARDADALIHIIEVSCRNKADVVARDEREQNVRAILNFGHTFGHAIEAAVGYGEWLHGEAVGCGMVMAASMSHRLGWITAPESARVRNLVARFRLPVTAPDSMAAEDFTRLMARDKKVAAGAVRLVLLRQFGAAELVADYPADALAQTLAEFTAAT